MVKMWIKILQGVAIAVKVLTHKIFTLNHAPPRGSQNLSSRGLNIRPRGYIASFTEIDGK